MEIAGHVALVTGGGSGLGAATARALAARGAKVGILDFDLAKAEAVAAEIGGVAFKCDVSDAASVEAGVQGIAAHFGAASRVIVNCAGIGTAARTVGREGKLALDLFDRTVKVNLYGTYNVISYATRALLAEDPLDTTERGVVINTSSGAYLDGQIGQGAYAASKGAIASMTLPLAREFAQHGIRVMAIAPGLFHTPMMEGLPEETSAKIIANIPFPARLGHAEEFGLLVSQIVENSYLNGEVIRLDGAVRFPPK